MKTVVSFNLDTKIVEELNKRVDAGDRSDYLNYLLKRKLNVD